MSRSRPPRRSSGIGQNIARFHPQSGTGPQLQTYPIHSRPDATGTDVLEVDQATGRRDFRFVHGPVFANMVLADEINRTPPKTQASLLEAMQEHHVTVGEKTFPLPEPFFVLAIVSFLSTSVTKQSTGKNLIPPSSP